MSKLRPKDDKSTSKTEITTNESDFIAPSTSKTSIKIPETIKRKLENNKNNDEDVKISLNDCLACSGCITSAETILIQQQSWRAFVDVLKFHNASLVRVLLFFVLI
jgi:iron only hydrogenase large subunit-like protein